MTGSTKPVVGRDNLAFDGTELPDYESDRSFNKITFKKGGRSRTEKVLLVVVVALFLALVAVVVVLIVVKNTDEGVMDRQSVAQDPEVCITNGCVAAAARIDSLIDYSVPYCDDFYQFSCGGWLKRNVIPDDKSSLDQFGLLRDQMENVLKSW